MFVFVIYVNILPSHIALCMFPPRKKVGTTLEFMDMNVCEFWMISQGNNISCEKPDKLTFVLEHLKVHNSVWISVCIWGA